MNPESHISHGKNLRVSAEDIVQVAKNHGILSKIQGYAMQTGIALSLLAGLADNADAQTKGGGTKASKPTADAKEKAGKAFFGWDVEK